MAGGETPPEPGVGGNAPVHRRPWSGLDRRHDLLGRVVEVVGRLPGAFRHPKLGYVDAFVMYRSLVAAT